jgi:hypothetical protein
LARAAREVEILIVVTGKSADSRVQVATVRLGQLQQTAAAVPCMVVPRRAVATVEMDCISERPQRPDLQRLTVTEVVQALVMAPRHLMG